METPYSRIRHDSGSWCCVLSIVCRLWLAPAPEDVRMVEVVGEGGEVLAALARAVRARARSPPGTYTDKWSASTSVWKTTVPGRGNSSPIVWGDRIFLTTGYGNGERLSMLAYARADGKKLWETFIPQNGVEYVHYKNGYASATPATDGQLVYASFGRHGLVRVRLQRQDRLAAQVRHHRQLSRARRIAGALQGSASSFTRIANPAPGRPRSSPPSTSATGQAIWQTPRRESVGWGTAVVINTGERDELIVSSQQRVAAYDPETRQGAVDRSRQHLRSDPDAGRRSRPGVRVIRPRRPDDRDPPRRQRRRHQHARRVELAARIAVRAVRRSSSATCST